MTIYLWQADADHVGKLASTVTVVSLISAPIWYFIKKSMDAADERRRASDNLISELEDTLRGLDPETNDNMREIKLDSRLVYFMSRMFNHDFYDSLVSSGGINFVDRSIQQPIQDVYHNIRDHNEYLQKIRRIQEGTESVSKRAGQYYLMLEAIEAKLLDAIPRTIKKLKGVA